MLQKASNTNIDIFFFHHTAQIKYNTTVRQNNLQQITHYQFGKTVFHSLK